MPISMESNNKAYSAHPNSAIRRLNIETTTSVLVAILSLSLPLMERKSHTNLVPMLKAALREVNTVAFYLVMSHAKTAYEEVQASLVMTNPI